MISAAFENPRGLQFIQMAGTSMATPVVSGIAAQVWSRARGLSYQDVKNILINAGPVMPPLQPITVSGRHIDSLSAVQAANTSQLLY